MQCLKKLYKHTGLLFLLPGLSGFTIFYVWPFFLSLGYAFTDKAVNGTFQGFKNFIDLFSNKAYLKGLFNTCKFIAVSVPLNMGAALGFSLMAKGLKKHRDLFTLVFLIPLVIPSGSMAFFWSSLFSYNGVLNGWLGLLGLGKVNWLDSNIAFAVMVLIFTWKNLGYIMVLYLDGLSQIPLDYYEAARMDGGKPGQIFRSITLPLLLPTSILVLIMSLINSFKVFREIYMITGNYPHDSIYTLQHFMNNMFASLNYPRLTTATAVLVTVIACFAQLLLNLERKASS